MSIPNEIWTEILGNVVVQDANMLPRLLCVNKHFYQLCQTEKLWYYAYRAKRPRWTYGIDYTDIDGQAWQELVQRQWDKEKCLQGIGDSTADQNDPTLEDQLELEGATIDDIDIALEAGANKLEQLASEYEIAVYQRSRVLITLSDAITALFPEPAPSATEEIPLNLRFQLIKSRMYEGSVADNDTVWVAIIHSPYSPERRLGVWSCSNGGLLFSYTLANNYRFTKIFWSYRILIIAKKFSTNAKVCYYKYYLCNMADPYTSPDPISISTPGFRCNSQYYLVNGKSLELVLLGKDVNLADQSMVVRYDITTRKRLVLHYHGDIPNDHLINDMLSQTGFFGVMVTLRNHRNLELWSASTGRLLAHLPFDGYIHSGGRWLTAPLTASGVDSTTVPRGPLRYLVTRDKEDASTGVYKKFIEVWHIALPDSEFSQVRWQDTLAEGGMGQIVPLQEPHLSPDPSERAQMQLLYRLPQFDKPTLHGGILLSRNSVPGQSGCALTAVDIETGRAGLSLGSLTWNSCSLNVVRGQLVYIAGDNVRILTLSDLPLQRQYASLVRRLESWRCMMHQQQRRRQHESQAEQA